MAVGLTREEVKNLYLRTMPCREVTTTRRPYIVVGPNVTPNDNWAAELANLGYRVVMLNPKGHPWQILPDRLGGWTWVMYERRFHPAT